MPSREQINSRIFQIVNKYANKACDKVQTEWSKYVSDVDGDSVIDSEISKAKSRIVATIYAYGQRAWILEYGRGSLMDNVNVNPYLNEYLQSEKINPWRKRKGSKAIYGRPEGEYEDLDGNTQWSSGKLSGVNLERLNTNPYEPLKGRHITNDILFGSSTDLDKSSQSKSATGLVSQMLDEIQQAIQQELLEVLQTLPKRIGR